MSTISKTPFLTTLHFLRGVCATGVAAYHFTSWQYGIQYWSVGTFGVYVFFILSAVVLLHVHSDDFSSCVTSASLREFYRKRFSRIVPLLAVSSVAYLLYYHFRYKIELSGLLQKTILTGSGLFALHIPGFLSTTTGAWSLAIELWFYLVFPIAALIFASLVTRAVVFTFVAILAAQQILLSTLPPSDNPMFWQQYTMPLTFAPFFAAGFVIHRFKRPSPSALNFWLSVGCLSLVFGFSFITDENVYRAGWPHLLLTVWSASAVWFALSAATPKMLDGFARWSGNISYSLYLTHWLSFELAKDLAPNAGLPIVFAAIAVTIAHLSWRYIEKPAERFLRSAGSPPTAR